MVGHQRRQPWTVDEDDATVDPRSEVLGLLREGGGRDEDALSSTLSLKRTSELLDLGPPDRILPPLGLHVDHVESQAVLLNDPVDATVATSSDGPSRVGEVPTVPHGDQYLNDQPFKEGWAHLLHLIEDLGLQLLASVDKQPQAPPGA